MSEVDTVKPAKTWKFTLNNYTAVEFERIKLWEVSRIAVGKEVGSEGTPHLQGYVSFRRAYRLSALKKLAPRAHWEVARCDDWNYELKLDSEDVYTQDNRTQGKRRDIDKAYEAVTAKKTRAQFVLEERPNYQAIRVFDIAQSLAAGPRPIQKIDVHWYFGTTGTGKTRAAFEENPGAYLCEDFKWWDGYVGQDVVIIDDVRADFCKFHEWLRLLDIYPLRKQIKGGWVECRFTKIIITAPVGPAEMWHSRTEEDLKQLLRRITCVKKFECTPLGTLVTEVGKGNTGFPNPVTNTIPFSAVSLPLDDDIIDLSQ